MADRVYQHFQAVTDPRLQDLVAEINNSLTIAGMVFGDAEGCVVVLLPNSHYYDGVGEVIRADVQDWAAILAQSDEPMVFGRDETGALKPMVRKTQFVVSQDVQQKIYYRDDFRCRYCGRQMGKEVNLTVDHVHPLESGGTNTPENLVAACRKCNKQKANMSAEAWCQKIGLDYQALLADIGRANREKLSC